LKKTLKDTLNQLGLIENNAIYFRNKEDGPVYFDFNSEVQKKIDIIKPDAYYVFNKQPLVLFFDLSELNSSKEREHSIHKQVWSFDNSPVIFAIKRREIKVYNALNFNKKENSLEEIELSEKERNERFSFWNLQSGTTWKWLQTEYFEVSRKKLHRKRVNERLFQNIKEVRETLIDEEKGLSENEANSLILRLIFIRYLIDRNVKIDDNYIIGSTLNARRKSFSQLIQNPKRLDELFIKLNENFNGVLFKDVNIKLAINQATFLAEVFKGEVQGQGTLFETYYFDIFDFSIIPVEVISGIYESLIDPETRDLQSAVYTPSFLVEYVLNDTLDNYLEEKRTSECKVFEVAVGSGIFLVQSLRRMIDKEIELNGIDSKKKFSERIRNIAKDNLFGLDINPEALKVTCFSIYIALLDYQSPKDIDKYPFPSLINENLFEANYFDADHKFNEVIKSVEPKFILGNPPWKNGSKDKVHTTYLKEKGLSNFVSDYQLAQSFVLRTKDFATDSNVPICSLVITSKSVYNNNASSFKKYFLENFFLRKCLDLSAVRRLIFEKANNPAMIIEFQYAKGESTFNNVVKHQSLKHNVFIKEFNSLVIEKRDNKEIKQELFYKFPWMFKVALYGDTIDFQTLIKLNKTQVTIAQFLKTKAIVNGNGISRGTPIKRFDFLNDLPLLENKLIKKYYTKLPKDIYRLTNDDIFLERGRTKDLFIGKKILLGKRTKNETELNVSFTEEDCAFKDSMNALSFNTENESEIAKLFSVFISELYTYYQYLTSSNWGVYYPEIHRTEYLAFPFKESNGSELEGLIDEFLKPYRDFYLNFNLGEPKLNKNVLLKINTIINDLYGLAEYEKDLINYVLNVSRYQFQEKKQYLISDFTNDDKSHYRNKDLVLKNYAKIYLNEFKEIYSNEFIQVEVFPLKYFVAMNFVFSKERPNKEITYPSNKLDEKKVLQRLANNLSISQITNTEDHTKNLFIQKDIKGFEKNSFYIIKPNEYKCWHRAIAWYDVAEFKEMIEDAELDNLTAVVNEF